MRPLDLLSDITIHSKYARYLPNELRRETWPEVVQRCADMHKRKYPHMAKQIQDTFDQYVVPKKVLPSMRSLQFAGDAIERANNRIYNCCALAVDDYRAFSETMFLLLGGTGVGYSVQPHHIRHLPAVRQPRTTYRFNIEDSIEGWADAVKALMKAFLCDKPLPKWDFGNIRPLGAPIKTGGGKAPGPEPLMRALAQIEIVLRQVKDGEWLSSLQCHDIMCHIADAVLAGGVRRSAMIALFDIHDEAMATCKYGTWYEQNPQRGRANNSAVVVRHKCRRGDFDKVFRRAMESGSGEPGIYFTNDKGWLTNPCAEIALRPMQFCNLCEINVGDVVDETDLICRAEAAAFIGTLQAGYTDFHYLRPEWRRVTEKEALIGISCTGIASAAHVEDCLNTVAQYVVNVNKFVADDIGVNYAARTTCVKPAGTTSLVLGTSSGIHAWHAPYYIRRMRFGKEEAIWQYLHDKVPFLCEDDKFQPTQGVLSIPVAAPDGALTREAEITIGMLERVKRWSEEWVRPGHVKGDNTHNVSATINVKEGEWDAVGEWMWRERGTFNGLSVLPYDGGTYVQAPFEEITMDEYLELASKLSQIDIDLREVVEYNDDVEHTAEVACAGGSCDI